MRILVRGGDCEVRQLEAEGSGGAGDRRAGEEEEGWGLRATWAPLIGSVGLAGPPVGPRLEVQQAGDGAPRHTRRFGHRLRSWLRRPHFLVSNGHEGPESDELTESLKISSALPVTNPVDSSVWKLLSHCYHPQQ